MAAFPELAPGGARKLRLFGVHRNDLEISANDEQVELPPCCFALPTFENNSSFQDTCGGQQAGFRCSDRSEK